MNADIVALWKPPTLANFNAASQASGKPIGFLHWTYAISLFIVSDALRADASPNTLKLKAARHVVGLMRGFVEREWEQRGNITNWQSDDYDAIAKEMADKLPRHPWVVQIVGEHLTHKRDVAFANHNLTHGDALFQVKAYRPSQFKGEQRKIFDELFDEQVNEEAIDTINRSLDYLTELRATAEYKKFIPLVRYLTSLVRVYRVVLGD